MNIEEYLQQEVTIRDGIHCHDGVWWKNNSFGTCSTLYQLQEFEPIIAKPSIKHSFIRYYHIVPAALIGKIKGTITIRNRMMIKGESLSNYSLGAISDRKRRQAINRALKYGFRVERIKDFTKHRSDFLEIYITNAERNYRGNHDWYKKNEDQWWSKLFEEHSLPGRDWFGVFYEDKLIAFLYACLVNGTAIWLVSKSNKDYLKKDPNDLLWHYTISHYQNIPNCSCVDAGWAISIPPSIDWRKRSMGFEPVPFFIYDHMNYLTSSAIKAALWLASPVLNSSIPYKNREGLLYKARVLQQIMTKR